MWIAPSGAPGPNSYSVAPSRASSGRQNTRCRVRSSLDSPSHRSENRFCRVMVILRSSGDLQRRGPTTPASTRCRENAASAAPNRYLVAGSTRRILVNLRRPSGQHALERRAILRLAVRGQHELDREVEQWTEPLDDIVARHVCAAPELDVQSVAEVGQRIAGDDRVDRGQPEYEIVVLPAGVCVDAERPRSWTVEVSFSLARAQPSEVVTLHAAHAVGIDAELLDPVLPRVGGRRVD